MQQTSASATEIINNVAAEVGLTPVTDPYASNDDNFIQLQYLLNATVRTLVRGFDWEFLEKDKIIDTAVDGTSGVYDLPSDYLRVINQTEWERTNRYPMRVLSSQQIAYLEGRSITSGTLYAVYRIKDGKFNVYPNPTPNDLKMAFKYVTNKCVLDSTTGTTYIPQINVGGDKPLFDSFLLERMLKVKWLEAKGFDATAAQDDLDSVYEQLTGSDTPSPVLDVGNKASSGRMLNSFNTPDTNFGS